MEDILSPALRQTVSQCVFKQKKARIFPGAIKWEYDLRGVIFDLDNNPLSHRILRHSHRHTRETDNIFLPVSDGKMTLDDLYLFATDGKMLSVFSHHRY